MTFEAWLRPHPVGIHGAAQGRSSAARLRRRYSHPMTGIFRAATIGLLLCLLSGCAFVVIHGVRHAYKTYIKPVSEVEAALARYRGLVLGMQTDKVALMFDASAELSHDDRAPVVGQAAISAYLNAFVGYKVLDYELAATGTTLKGETAIQLGNYRQTMAAPGGETVADRGRFEARWSHQADGSWLISRLHTASVSVSTGS